MAQTLWDNDLIQFARLIAEMESLGILADHQEQIQEELDLEPSELAELIDRAQTIYDASKARLAHLGATTSSESKDPPVIKAETHTDDHAIKVEFDATPYFRQAPEEDLARLIECGFAGDQPADWVAQGLAENNPEVGAMFTYLEARNRASRKSIGFEVSVDEEQALAWLREHRPGAFRTLNLGDYDLAKCDSCGLISDRDTMSKREKTGDMRCEECQTVCWWVTKNPDTGDIEIPQGIHPGGDLYPSTDHALGYIEGPEPGDDTTWDANWHEALLELNEDGTAVRPIASDQPWAPLHDRRAAD